jgi:hypothetical protein
MCPQLEKVALQPGAEMFDTEKLSVKLGVVYFGLGEFFAKKIPAAAIAGLTVSV